MVRVAVDSRDAVSKLRATPDALQRAAARWQAVGGQYVRGVMVRTIRQSQKTEGRTGFLSNSVVARQTTRGFQVAATASYAVYVDQPTRPHVIRPKDPDGVLAFPGLGINARRGGTVFAKYVNHPGTRGMFFADRTAREVAAPLDDLLLREADRELRSLGEA